MYEFKAGAKGKEGNKCFKCGRRTKAKLKPPAELADKEEMVSLAGREYSLLFSLWPPMQAFLLQSVPDDFNPENYEQRYPKDGDRQLALITARAKELKAFLPPELFAHISNKWFKSVVRRYSESCCA